MDKFIPNRPMFKLINKDNSELRFEDKRRKMGCAICSKDVEFNKDALFVWINFAPNPWPDQQYVCSRICAEMFMLQVM